MYTPLKDAPALVGTTSEATPAPVLSGRVLFPIERQTQAAMTDVAVAATVSLINTGSNQTVATTLTNAAGQFVLSFGKDFQPDPSAVYYLEALKGLDNNRPSSSVARVRTLARFQSGAWTTLTSGSILISRSTTALSIGAALKQGTATPVDFSALIGKLVPGATSEQDVYTPVTNLSGTDFTALLALVTTNLTADRDPVATLGYNAGTSAWVNMSSAGGGGFTVTGATPASGSAGTSVTLAGTGFRITLASNSVTFAGTTATVTAATATSLTTTVPTGAVSGQVVVTVDGTSALGPLFTVPVTVTSFSPTAGTAGTTVTVTGTGFSTTPADNLVLFNNQQAIVTGATATSLTVTVPATTTGKVSVFVKGSSGTSAGDFTYGNPLLATITPSMATTGATLTLEGNFGNTAIVNFPGGSSVAATLLGPSRATVTVPAAATAGNLSVTTGGVTTNSLSFRRAAFALGNSGGLWSTPDQASGGRAKPRLVSPRYGHVSVVLGNYLYVIGGSAASTPEVERATINADGTLGSFSTQSGVRLVTHRSNFTWARIGNYLYVMGGGGTTVERATIHADNSLSTFSVVSGVTLVKPRGYPTSAVIGNYLYVLGGYNGTDGTMGSVERAVINDDGSIGTFNLVTGVNFVAPRYGHSVAVIEDQLYVISGTTDGTNALTSVERSTIQTNGTLSGFATVSGVTLVTGRTGHATVVAGNNLYVIAGGTYGAYFDDVERATITGSNISTFAKVNGLTSSAPRGWVSSAIVGDGVYVIGGYTTGPGYQDLVERLSLNSSGNLSAFTSATAMPEERSGHGIAVVGDNLYLIGGHGPSGRLNNILRAKVGASGTLGSFTAQANSTFVVSRTLYTTAIIGRYLYVIGGQGDAGHLATIERAAIYDDGSLGPWTAVSATLTTGRSNHTTLVSGGFLYVLGGSTNNSGYETTIERATIGANGDLSNFGPAGISLVTGRNRFSAVILGNRAYVVGGVWSGGTTNSIERATINSDGSFTGFETAPVSLATGRIEPSLAVVGNYLYAIAGANHGLGPLKTVDRALINSDGTLGVFGEVGGVVLAIGRGLQRGVVVRDRLYITGGYTDGSVYTGSIESATLQ